MVDTAKDRRNWSALVTVRVLSSESADRAVRALSPEAVDVVGKGTVHLERRGNHILFEMESESLSALRAALNSYLRWLTLIEGVDAIARGMKDK